MYNALIGAAGDGREACAGARPAFSVVAGPYLVIIRSAERRGIHDSRPIFGAMLQEFDGAARILNLEPGIWQILTHPKRQVTVSCPVPDGQRRDRGFTGYRVQYNITLGPAKGGIRYHPASLSMR